MTAIIYAILSLLTLVFCYVVYLNMAKLRQQATIQANQYQSEISNLRKLISELRQENLQLKLEAIDLKQHATANTKSPINARLQPTTTKIIARASRPDAPAQATTNNQDDLRRTQDNNRLLTQSLTDDTAPAQAKPSVDDPKADYHGNGGSFSGSGARGSWDNPSHSHSSSHSSDSYSSSSSSYSSSDSSSSSCDSSSSSCF